MKAQLVKRQDRFDLYNESDGSKIASTSPNPMGRLSLKNCEAIANGYDLMKLAEEYSNKYYDIRTTDWHCNYNGFFGGFQKALEIFGDKKFSETDLYRAFLINSSGNNTTLENTFKETVLPMFQQTEFDVEIEMWFHGTRHKKGEWIPKLDADGCLILKRIQ